MPLEFEGAAGRSAGTRTTPRGSRPGMTPRHPSPFSQSMRSWDDELLDALREEGDPTTDGVVAAYFADLGLDEPGRLVRLLVHHGELPAEEQNPAVAAYLAEHPGLPEWADPELITQACEFFGEHGPHIVSILYSASLP